MFKTIANKLFNASKKEPLKRPELKPVIHEVTTPISSKITFPKGTYANNPPGTNKVPPSMMPGIDPLPRRIHGEGNFSPTSRYLHKPWPKNG